MTQTLHHTHDDVNIHAAFCLAFAAFLRPSELTWKTWDSSSYLAHLSRGSIEFTPAGMLLHLPKSKTDQLRAGVSIPIAPSGNDKTCPVGSLHALLKKYPKHRHAPLFCRHVGPFDYEYFTSRIQTALLQAGFDPQGFTGHSFRRGAANTAIQAGIDKKDVMDMGRWKSSAIDTYISQHTTTSKLYHLSARLHHNSGPQPASPPSITSLPSLTSRPVLGVSPSASVPGASAKTRW